MVGRRADTAVALVLAVLAMAFGASLVGTPGTIDMTVWARWMEAVRQSGIVEGYARADVHDYPPGCFLVFKLAVWGAAIFHISPATALKLLLLCASMLSACVLGLWCRSLAAGAALMFSLALSAVGLGYLDVCFLPPLLAAVWAAQKRKILLASFLFTTACAMKYQPLIVAPFFFAYLVRAALPPMSWGWQSPVRPFVRIVLGVSPVAAVVLASFDLGALGRSFQSTLQHTAWSYQALNINWIVQLAAYRQAGLVGQPYYAVSPAPQVLVAMRVCLAVVFAWLLAVQVRRGPRFEPFAACALLATLAYFQISAGVHENHLFLSMALAFSMLAARGRHAAVAAGGIAAAFNLNLVMFYGLDGKGLPTIHSWFGALTGIAAAGTVIFTIWLFFVLLKREPADRP